MAVNDFFITQKWFTKRDNYKTPAFDTFFMSFFKYKGSKIDVISVIQLTKELDNLHIDNKNIIKMFDCFYKGKHNVLKGTVWDDITGFCDVTDFLKIIKNNDEKGYLIQALNDFISYGGIIRINDEDYSYLDKEDISRAVEQNTTIIIN